MGFQQPKDFSSETLRCGRLCGETKKIKIGLVGGSL